MHIIQSLNLGISACTFDLVSILTNAIWNYITIHGILYFNEFLYQICSENGPNFIVISMTFNYITTANNITSSDKHHEVAPSIAFAGPRLIKYLIKEHFKTFVLTVVFLVLVFCFLFVRHSVPTLFYRLFFFMVWWIDLKLAVYLHNDTLYRSSLTSYFYLNVFKRIFFKCYSNLDRVRATLEWCST